MKLSERKSPNAKKNKNKRKTVIAVLIAVFICGFTFEWIGESIDEKRFKPPGKIVEINGHKMHIYAQGVPSSKPTVIFTSGWKTPSPYVDYYPLQKEVAKYTRAVVYERPGYGWSEVVDGERDIDTITRELHELLTKAGEKGPYILVGHSFGANEVLRFAQLYKTEVSGVLLIDGSNPDYTITQERPLDFPLWYGTVTNTVFNNVINLLNKFCITRLLFMATDLYTTKFTSYKNSLSIAPEELRELDESMFIKTLNNKNHLQELRMDAKQLVNYRGIGDIPLVVVTSSLYNDSESTKNIQGGLLKWSARSEQIVVKDSQHYVHWFKPQIINSKIEEMVKAY